MASGGRSSVTTGIALCSQGPVENDGEYRLLLICLDDWYILNQDIFKLSERIHFSGFMLNESAKVMVNRHYSAAL
ncbi:hypothetical protein ACM39_05320 [Chryseobacterium sp. FH2]|nr:hypothetical protein ACM39_05320 [Chryseobacterium sp. FH2]